MNDEPGTPPDPNARGRIGESVAVLISSAVMILFGIWVMIIALRSDHSIGGLMMATAITIVLLLVGGSGLFIGIRRLLWRRTYRRLFGEDPWEEEEG